MKMANSVIPHHIHIFISNSSLLSMFKLPLSFPPPLLDVEYRDQSLRDAVSGLRLHSEGLACKSLPPRPCK